MTAARTPGPPVGPELLKELQGVVGRTPLDAGPWSEPAKLRFRMAGALTFHFELVTSSISCAPGFHSIPRSPAVAKLPATSSYSSIAGCLPVMARLAREDRS